MKAIIAIVLLSILSSGGSPRRIMLDQKVEILRDGKVLTQSSSIFYSHDAGKMVVLFHKPQEMVLILNRHGELKVYDPKKNEVYLESSLAYSTDLSLYYFFMAGKTYDLGLREMGFTLQDTRFEDGLMISEYYPPSGHGEGPGKVELAHEDDLPVFAGYFDQQMDLRRRVHYYDYQRFGNISFPMSSVEFDYLESGDSIITRKTNSNIRTGSQATSPHFDFSIPEDAKTVTSESFDIKTGE